MEKVFDELSISLATSDQMRSWSFGEVKKPETINYRTLKPEKDGLFDERIFGPTKDWECSCGRYKRIRYRGIVCERCGVEVTRREVRRERMGHIELAAPVTHIWYFKGVPSRLGYFLDMSPKELEKIIYFAAYLVVSIDEKKRTKDLSELEEAVVAECEIVDEDHQEWESKRIKQMKLEIKAMENGKVPEAEVQERKKDIEKEIKGKKKKSDDEIEVIKNAFSRLKTLKPKDIIEDDTLWREMIDKYDEYFTGGMGAEAVRELVKLVDLKAEMEKLKSDLDSKSAQRRQRAIQRMKVIKPFADGKNPPEAMILEIVPVIPPELRPMVQLDGGRFATSDLNDLYRRVINRNNRLKRLLDLKAPEVIQRNEKRMLQEAIDALIDNNARHSKTVTASTGQKRQLKSIADILKGKQGRFRQNLLGKRVDYSGRSVIVVGPHLKIYQCGLPKTMALELFRPFVISQLIKQELVHNVRSANRYIEARHPEVWAILEDVVVGAHVMLNRAPTLHRLGIQAFQPTLIEGKAIQLHPLVCSAFNADFDGDQMAVHVPLTEEAKEEAKTLMLSSNNLLKPATGDPVAVPNQDIVWGGYYLTYIDPDAKVKKAFTNEDEAEKAFALGIIGLQDLIKVRVARAKNEILETSVGRILFNRILPAEMEYVNNLLDKKGLKDIVALAFRTLSHDKTVVLLDEIKDIAFKYITASGSSWGMDDIPKLKSKKALIQEGETKVLEIKEQYNQGLLTNNERYIKVIEVWNEIKNRIYKEAEAIFDPKNSVASIINSGARGSMSQVIQIMGMKGLVINPAGEIIELPVKANFQEGLDVLEYFISTHGTRKGLSDTALRTANAGYLTRRLVDVSQDVVILESDCKDKEGLIITKEESKELNETLEERSIGRTLLESIVDPKTKKVLIKKGVLVSKELSEHIGKVDPDYIKIRSLLSCKSVRGACQKCYGFDLGFNKPVKIGTAVGIVAAQSIGEPGTQLTMRTFHTGGVAESDITQGLPRVEELFEARQPKKKSILAPISGIVHIDDDNQLISKEQRIINIKPQEIRVEEYEMSERITPKVEDGQEVEADQVIFLDKKDKVRTKLDGVIKLTAKTLKVISKEGSMQEVIIPAGYNIWVKNKDIVSEGQQITEGSIELKELYALKGKLSVQKYIIKEIKHIYASQGQNLNDKHVELIVKQMFSRILINEIGDTELLPGEVVTSTQFEEANLGSKGDKASGDILLLGITKAALTSDSFLSAASFQETARVLIDAAISGKVDYLKGLKENVIIGRKIPAGTGFEAKK